MSLPGAREAIALARQSDGALGGLSAARHWNWKVKHDPVKPIIIVPRNRGRAVSGALTRRRDVPVDQRKGFVLERHATVIDCALTLPFDEALSVADSALRRPEVDQGLLLEMAAGLVRGRDRVERVLHLADGRAANPFESVARAIAQDVAGLCVVAQGWVGGNDHSDLVDHRLGIAVECESWLWHGDEDAWRKDVRRYTRMALEGWIVVRLLWHDVMYRPDIVREQLIAAVALGRARRDTFQYAASAGRQADRR
ncbi:hypothetical protein [Nocardioides sp.]|uniref:hypothetical protein n=1 Tax=Nocardioides sp. TaxID=35761 RepID=UPI002C33CD6C|nr:hypothetical protein [Nocardioides sp.]HSX67571.1 hypothetical protein [Nocardioides sp.]